MQTFSAFAMFSYIPLLVPIAEELHLSSKQIGMIVTSNAMGGILFGITSGWLVDRLRTRFIILLGPGVIVFSLLIFSISKSYYMILFANLFLGIGYTILLPLTNRLIAFYFSNNQLGMLVSLKHSGSTVGQAMGGFLLPILIIGYSWRFSLNILTVIMVIVVLFCFVYFYSKDTIHHAEKEMNIKTERVIPVITKTKTIKPSYLKRLYFYF